MDKRFTRIRPTIHEAGNGISLIDIIQTYYSQRSKNYVELAEYYISKWCEEEAKMELPLGEIKYGELETTDTIDYAKIVESVLNFVLCSKENSHINLPYACDLADQLLNTILETIKKNQK